MLLDVCVHFFCARVTRGRRFGLYCVYCEFLVINSAQLSSGSAPEFDAGWFLIVFFQFVLEFSKLCLCVLLDKKLHGVNIGRKFFLAEQSGAARKRA
jgi:hypothetical protein